MIRNYIKIAWRNLLRDWKYALLKVGGLALSIAACILIVLFIVHETSYDHFYPDANRIFRVTGQATFDEKQSKGVSFEPPFAKAMKVDFPEIELAGRLLPSPLFGAGSNQISTMDNQKSNHEDGVVYMDQELLDLLQLPMVDGRREEALLSPNSVVLTATKAKKYFPEGSPIGKVIYLNNDTSKPFTVNGVIADLPSTSHLHGYAIFLTLTDIHFYDGEQDSWTSSNYVTYFKIKPNTDIPMLADKMTKNVIENYKIPTIQSEGRSIPEFLNTFQLNLQPISDIHLYSHDIRDYYEAGSKGDIRFIWLFGGITVFILLIACINFVNLSTAKSAGRAKEIGLRKVVGSRRKSLIIQFLAESTLYSLLSVLIGMVLAWLLLPSFNQLADKQLVFPWSDIRWMPIVGFVILIVGFLAGIYPALYLSGFKPLLAIKGQTSRADKSNILRNSLVVFQFASSIILIVGTLIINNQMDFILNRKIGFDKEQVLIVQGTHTLGEKIPAFKHELLNISGVQHVSVSDFLPVKMDGVRRDGNLFWREGRVNIDPLVSGQTWRVDEDYLATMGLKIVEGRDFDKNLASDSEAVIINQSLANALQLEDPIGAEITNGWKKATVIAVVEDFNFESMKENIGGLCLTLGNSPSMMAVKINAENLSTTMGAITEKWKSFAPDQVLRYTFLDEGFARMYSGVLRTGYIFSCFSVLAIMIACLGLFGLAAFTTEQRTKEIGIRKVLGASVASVVTLLSKDFVKLVFVAIIIASPIAWWAMNKWLEDFAYRIDIQWWMFVLAGLLAIGIALFTVSWQSIRAAVANPVDSLRDE